jgi:hypothetical protein
MTKMKRTLGMLILVSGLAMAAAAADRKLDYQVLSTSRTSTMERELNSAAASGYRFFKVTNGRNAFGGQELIVVTVKDLNGSVSEARKYRLLTAARTSTLQKKLQQFADDGYQYLDQTTFVNALGGKEVVVILERRE